MPPTGPARTRSLWILALLVALALGMRLTSAGRLLPHCREPDAFEVYEMQRAQHDPALVKGVNFERRYPWFLAWTLAALPAARPPADSSAADAEERHLEAAAQPFLRVRIAVALLATLQVLLTFFLARRFLPESQALVAVFLVGTSLLHLLFSVEARPHGANAGLSLLALIAALQLAERFSLGRLALAILSSAVAIATFQLGLATLPPLFLACLLLPARAPVQRIALAVLAPLAALALALPWYTNPPIEIDATGVHLASQDGGGHTLFFQNMDFLGAWRGAQLLFEHDPLLALLAAAGLLLLLARARGAWRRAQTGTHRALLIACGFALPYALVITIQGEVYERFLIPLVPFLAILGALGLRALWERPLTSPLALAALGLASLSAGQFVHLALAPDAYEQAAQWIRDHAGDEQKIALFPDNSLPLLYSPAAVAAQMEDRAARNVPWVTYQATIPALLLGTRSWNVRCVPILLVLPSEGPDIGRMREWLADERVDYLVVEYSQRMWRMPILPSLERAASELGELAFVSSGAAPGLVEQGALDYQSIRHFAWRQWQQAALGPELRIWKLSRR